MEPVIKMENLIIENVKELTEDQAAELLNLIETEPDREKRSHCTRILQTSFEFRTIAAKSRNLKGDLAFLGYKFFPVANNPRFLRGIRKHGNIQ